MEHTQTFPRVSFVESTKHMLASDAHRMARSRVFYIILACALVVPILMTVMLTMMDGQESIDQTTGDVVIMQGPDSVWQSIGTLPSDTPETGETSMGADMDVMAMCNINMAFMGVCVFVCLFISDDFRSGYQKNLFTSRPSKVAYVISKTLMGFITGALMLILYFIGTLLSGAMCSLSFALAPTMSVGSVVLCLLSKIFLMLVFVSIFVLISVAAKEKAWLSICGSLGGGMLLFMTVSLITPLNATPIHLILCLVGGVLFATGLGACSNLILKKTALV